MADVKDLQDAVSTCRRVMLESKAEFLAGMLPDVRSGDDLPFALERLDTLAALARLRPPRPQVTEALKRARAAADRLLGS